MKQTSILPFPAGHNPGLSPNGYAPCHLRDTLTPELTAFSSLHNFLHCINRISITQNNTIVYQSHRITQYTLEIILIPAHLIPCKGSWKQGRTVPFVHVCISDYKSEDILVFVFLQFVCLYTKRDIILNIVVFTCTEFTYALTSGATAR